MLHPSDWWGDWFWESHNIDWSSFPGQISLQQVPASDPGPAPAFPSREDDLCSGTLVSSLAWVPMGTDWGIEWGDITWSAFEPDSAEIYFQLRTGNDPYSMSAWGEPIYESGTYLGDLLPDDIHLIQYTVCLQSDSFDPDSWPIVYEVTIEGWYPGGIGDDPIGSGQGSVLQVHGNPGVGTVLLSVTGPLPAEVDLTVFDLAGRKVSTLFQGELANGRNEYVFSAAPGVYFARLVSGNTMESVALVLTE